MTRRVRKLAPIGRFQPFLGSDFTYADIGLLPLQNRRFEVGPPSVIDGTPVHQVVEYPQPNFYYGKVVNWISTKGLPPVRRDFYAPSDLLWKRQYFEEVVEIENIPTPTRVRMVDELARESSVIDTKEVRFTTVPDDVFEPDRLPTLIDHPIWNR